LLIITEYNHPYIIADLTAPIVPKFNWIFSTELMDFVLSPIMYLEETTGPALKVMINKYAFDIPASWNIMVVDEETMMTDTIPIADCSTKSYKAFLFCPTSMNLFLDDIKFVDFVPHISLCHTSIPKNSMICHPVGPNDNKEDQQLNCLLGPYDLWRLMQNITAKELLY
jgi:hypothetical protein